MGVTTANNVKMVFFVFFSPFSKYVAGEREMSVEPYKHTVCRPQLLKSQGTSSENPCPPHLAIALVEIGYDEALALAGMMTEGLRSISLRFDFVSM